MSYLAIGGITDPLCAPLGRGGAVTVSHWLAFSSARGGPGRVRGSAGRAGRRWLAPIIGGQTSAAGCRGGLVYTGAHATRTEAAAAAAAAAAAVKRSKNGGPWCSQTRYSGPARPAGHAQEVPSPGGAFESP